MDFLDRNQRNLHNIGGVQSMVWEDFAFPNAPADDMDVQATSEDDARVEFV
jgi:hypothetical protein